MRTFIECLSNAFLPFVCMTMNISLFLIFFMVYFCLPIYAAFQEKHYKVNHIIQSLYLPIFHLGVIGMTFFNNQNSPEIFHNTGVIITIIIFVGAIHQAISLFIGLLYDIGVAIYATCAQISNVRRVEEDLLQTKKITTKMTISMAHMQKAKFNSKFQQEAREIEFDYNV